MSELSRAELHAPAKRIGLRFPKSQARVLRNLAHRAKVRELDGEAISLFEKAANATATGDPLVVWYTEPVEIDLLVAGFVRYGVARPTVEELVQPGSQ